MERAIQALVLGIVLSGGVACGAASQVEWEEPEAPAREQAVVFRHLQDGRQPSVSYAGTEDASVMKRHPDVNYGSSPSCSAKGFEREGACLLRWELEKIPAGWHVASVSIRVRVLLESAQTFEVRALKRSWAEREVSWNVATAAHAWQGSGAVADEDRGPVVGTLVGTGKRGFATVELNAAGIALVQSWHEGAPNHGLIIANATNGDGIRLASSDHRSARFRPTLSVGYSVP